jgi:uncharacterized membrane protein YeaQ/YmgE (transglycosylase-associated protein family)
MSKRDKRWLSVVAMILVYTLMTKGFQEFAKLLADFLHAITFYFKLLAIFLYELEGTNVLASVVVGLVTAYLASKILNEVDFGGSRNSKSLKVLLSIAISSVLMFLTGWFFNPVLEWMIYSNN